MVNALSLWPQLTCFAFISKFFFLARNQSRRQLRLQLSRIWKLFAEVQTQPKENLKQKGERTVASLVEAAAFCCCTSCTLPSLRTRRVMPIFLSMFMWSWLPGTNSLARSCRGPPCVLKSTDVLDFWLRRIKISKNKESINSLSVFDRSSQLNV